MPHIDVNKLLLIVTGAHLRAEAGDRPLAYQLQAAIVDWLAEHAAGDDPLVPLTCTDVWYLNAEELHARPLISLGGPGVNALAAYLAQRVPPVLTVEDRLFIQMDLEFTDLRVSVWGHNGRSTAAALKLFQEPPPKSVAPSNEKTENASVRKRPFNMFRVLYFIAASLRLQRVEGCPRRNVEHTIAGHRGGKHRSSHICFKKRPFQSPCL